MIKYLIDKPVSVLMAFIAFFILGIITYMNIPISLLPDIDIPEISVQISGKNTSARELENTVVNRIRQQLMQVGNLRDIRSETCDGNAVVHLSFEYGVDTHLAFIEVNEKIDAAMNYLPKEIERPRVIKASATDIPVFNLDLTLCSDSSFEYTDINKFIELSEFTESVIRRRFEQLPQIAMIDVSGLIKKQIVISPDQEMLDVSGITLSDLEEALNDNNVEPGSMSVRDGHYEYVIRFSSILRTLEDIENIYIRKNDRIYQLKDMAKIEFVPQKEQGMAIYNGKRAIVLSVIKQSEENFDDLQFAVNEVVEQFQKDFPEIEFHITQNQTELLDYTISNLQENLILAFIFVFLISVIFLKDGRSSIIIGIGLFVSLVISLLFFFLFHISLNVVSLTGLILASGNMIDNSIIVSDNIGQHRKKGSSLSEACVIGTNEVSTPMLSSALTNIAVFIPLIFMSGIAGAVFFDQAFSVTVGLLTSYLTGITLLPILYKLIYSVNIPDIHWSSSKKNKKKERKKYPVEEMYHKGICWIFSHKVLTLAVMLVVFPICFWLFVIIKKEKMPNINQNEVIVHIEWNENIHIQENHDRCISFLRELKHQTKETSGLVGQQQFLLNKDWNLTSTEAEIYIKTETPSEINRLKNEIGKYFVDQYPNSSVTFSPVGNIFEKIFTIGEPDLVIEYYIDDKTKKIDKETILSIQNKLEHITGEIAIVTSFQNQINIHIDKAKLLLYNVPYDLVYKSLITAFKENQFATLRSQQQYLPILLVDEERSIKDIIDNTLIETSIKSDGSRNKLALSTFVTITSSEDMKTIVSGKTGEYVPFYFFETKNTDQIVDKIRGITDVNWEIGFSGAFFLNKKMIKEMVIILLVSIGLMYFILASQFESLKQPLIVLLEIPIDIAAALGLLIITGHSLNLMSAIGIVVTCGIIINDSILKVDMMNQLRKKGLPLIEAIHEAGHRRLKAILMTSMTSIVCMVPLLFSDDLGSNLEKPLAIATIGGMVVGTPISLFVVPLAYWWIYRKEEK
ncbi:efflux RND transporter permease subunit [Dysgonomonas macrotermitis]|uniref:Multidrug efflux pump subunit AcrB n=1 Tax=Dysgonomonas macrotermitis TaxID=1346286 RepID=A0A1M4WKZ0_9BACT|nr:efflux RND transporter permease subunit [Dysgonomonas macrotermitis]SHE81723.1 Multidrug efflux pump subunit AcrB [Dysgonomonas macrotermitis]